MMCTSGCIKFGEFVLHADQVAGKSVLEVGSYNVNGSLRSVASRFGPREYVGVDLILCNHVASPCTATPCVDRVCDAANLLAEFGSDRFDVVISTELLEHAKDWRKAIHNLKGVLKPGGSLVLTTRSPGFFRHDYPSDYWRFTYHDMKAIFSDLVVEHLQDDPAQPGIFVSGKKPYDFRENDLSCYDVFSMATPEFFYYIAARNQGVPAMEKGFAVRCFRIPEDAMDLCRTLNQVVGWGLFGVVEAKYANDTSYNAKFLTTDRQ